MTQDAYEQVFGVVVSFGKRVTALVKYVLNR
jgi:hypothetical protein